MKEKKMARKKPTAVRVIMVSPTGEKMRPVNLDIHDSLTVTRSGTIKWQASDVDISLANAYMLYTGRFRGMPVFEVRVRVNKEIVKRALESFGREMV